MNFFGWIRDGVRQAVLLGVHDAVSDLGTPSEDNDIRIRLAEVVRQAPPALTATAEAIEPAKRRKLGRGLQDIQAGVQAAAKAG